MRAWPTALLLLAACGGAPAPAISSGASQPLTVEVDSAVGPDWLRQPDLPERTLSAASVAAQRWGGADLRDWTVRFVSRIDACGAAEAGQASGCTRHDQRTIELAVDAASPCVEGTALLHEVGHVAIPDDPDHRDPRWSSPAFWVDLLGAVQAQEAPGATACDEALSVWRIWWKAREAPAP
ncbi:hypothetical protein [Anaeromyxobacter paludicola]|uniref:Lipoprotein n=1 Tax=Anaeromyxobacter paludicola TaxID=2918171 RepID=A0ABM7XB96_9BACT|nr:hypothetical protein [Anaeromyxobacter paludicola]BDG09133.1 hypothetical protein AMPC_22460 [Anaeromyxobacter paludicola]